MTQSEQPPRGRSLPRTEEAPQHHPWGGGGNTGLYCASAHSVDLCRLFCHQKWRQRRQVGKEVQRGLQFQERREKSVGIVFTYDQKWSYCF